MDDILDIRPDEQTAHIQPGVVQDDLDDTLASTVSSSRRTRVVNRPRWSAASKQPTGAHSVRYGITDAYTDAVKAVLSDGSLLHAREVVIDSPEWDDIVSRTTARPTSTRRSAKSSKRTPTTSKPLPRPQTPGVGLQPRPRYLENDDGERVLILAKLFVGSEGTLGVIVEADFRW